MVELFNKLGSETFFPGDTMKANVTVIPTEGRDTTCCGFLNCVLKLLTKIIASSIAQHLQQLLHLDQVGFNPSR